MDLSDLTVSSIMAGFVFGVWGMFLIRQGRKEGNFWHGGLGCAMLVYPFFVTGPWLTWGIGCGLLYLAYQKR